MNELIEAINALTKTLNMFGVVFFYFAVGFLFLYLLRILLKD